MHAPVNVAKKLAAGSQLKLALAVGTTLLGLTALTGCDDSRASDKGVYNALKDKDTRGPVYTEAAATAKIANLEAALQKNSNAGPAGKAAAAATLAQVENAEGNRLMHSLEDGQRNALRLITELNGVGLQVNLVNTQLMAYKQGEPSAAHSLADSQTAEVQGSADKGVWFEHQSASIPTLTAVRQNISKLQGEITKLQSQLKGFQDQRAQVLTQADQLQQQSEQQKGKQSVDTFTQASAARKKASEIQNQIELTQASIVPLERDLAIAQGQEKAAASAVDLYKNLVDSMDKGWTDVQAQMKASQDLVAKLVGTGAATAEGDKEVPMTVSAKAQELAAQLAENQSMFDSAEQHLNNAIKHYGDASTAASSYTSQSQLPPEIDRNSISGKASEMAKAALDPAGFKLNESQARQSLGVLQASRALVLTTLVRMTDNLKQTLDAAGQEMPEALAGGKFEADLDHSRELANTAFEEAATGFTDASSGGALSPERKNVARVGLVLAKYGNAQVAQAAGNAPEAAQLLADARATIQAAVDEGASLPPLPAELVPAPTTTPTSAPSTAKAAPAVAAPEAAPAAPAPDATPAPAATPAPEATPSVEAAPSPDATPGATPPAEGAQPDAEPETSPAP